MAFPEAPRVLYELNPLHEVICQLRFPPVLRIETEVPSGFQERIRASFPYYEAKPSLKLPAGLPPDVVSSLIQGTPLGLGPTHEFSSADKQWVVSLTREFLALTCRRYERWERFRDMLRGPLDALLEIYTPSFYTRVGLRYIDLIRRSVLGLDQVGWDQLLKPWVAGPFGSPEIASTVEHAASDFLIAVPEIESRLRVRHGVVLHPDSQESCYLIDADFFDERRTEITDVFPRLDALNRQAGLFFRWCIRDRLHEAMRPRQLV